MIYTKDNPKLVENFYDFEGIDTFTGVVKDNSDTVAYYLNGKSHRENGPAVENADGGKFWLLDGQYHRTDGPAIIYADGNKDWYLNDKCYGYDNDFTNESWIRFAKLLLLQ